MLTDEQDSSRKKQWIQLNNNGNTEMLTDEQTSSWKKAMNSIQQNGRK